MCSAFTRAACTWGLHAYGARSHSCDDTPPRLMAFLLWSIHMQIKALCQRIGSETGVKVIYAPADLRRPAEIRTMVTGVADSFGEKLDILGGRRKH